MMKAVTILRATRRKPADCAARAPLNSDLGASTGFIAFDPTRTPA